MQIKILGKASQTTSLLEIEPEHFQLSLMDYLNLKGFAIASSCSGVGVCKKCIVNEDLVSCQITLQEVIEQKLKVISIDYR